jgi:hypothetical protein
MIKIIVLLFPLLIALKALTNPTLTFSLNITSPS